VSKIERLQVAERRGGEHPLQKRKAESPEDKLRGIGGSERKKKKKKKKK